MAHFEASLLLARCAWGGERLPGRMTTRGEQLQCEWEEVNFWCAVEDGAEKGDGVPLSGCIRAARTMRYFYYILRRSNLWIFLSVPFSIYSLIDPLSLILPFFADTPDPIWKTVGAAATAQLEWQVLSGVFVDKKCFFVGLRQVMRVPSYHQVLCIF